MTLPRLATVGAVAILLAATVQGHAAHDERREGYTRLAVEGRFLWTAGRDDVLYDPAHPAWHHSGVLFLRRMNDPGESAGVARPGDPLALMDEGRAFWRYDPASRQIRPMDAGELERERLHWRPMVDWSRSLAVTILYDDRAKRVSWQLGPYSGDGFFFLTNGYLTRVAAAGQLRFPLDRDQPIHVRYDSPEGWRTYSDLLVLPVRHAEQTRVDWRR